LLEIPWKEKAAEITTFSNIIHQRGRAIGCFKDFLTPKIPQNPKWVAGT
jgi:prepilin signal peptidase PulO-like enzyme (type II secretory pathway)